MGRRADSGRVNLAGIFQQTQGEMLSQLAAGELIEHPTACGAVTERHWLDLLGRHLPERYRAASAFVVDAEGRRSRQLDVVIFDRLYSPLLYPECMGLHIPAESVYGVFEVKQDLNQRLIRDAGRKVGSVRRLGRTSVAVIAGGEMRGAIRPRRILGGILALRSGWPTRYQRRLPGALRELKEEESLDLGIALRDGAFEAREGKVKFSTKEESLVFFMFRLMERLREMGTAPAVDLMAYGRGLESFKEKDEGGRGSCAGMRRGR